MKSFKRHITKWEKFALSVIVILLLVSVVEQTFYGGETFLFMVVMLMCLLIMSFLLFCPNKYKFDENALIFIYPKPLKNKIINYETMLYYDTVGSFIISKGDINAVEVLITYRNKNSAFKKTVCCHPKDVLDFVKTLQQMCPKIIDV